MSGDKHSAALTVRGMVFTALFTAVTCALAPFSIAVGPIPLSLATFAVYLAAGTQGLKTGVLSIALYVLLGAVGLPVFANFEGGLHKLAGVTGGFIIGYIPCAAVIGYMTETFSSRLLSYITGMVLGTVLLYGCGMAWFMLQTGNTFATSLILCVAPFLPGDAIKIAAAYAIAPRLRAAIRLL